jgi:predicted DNA-binding protein (MmcQ/YjbR family)
MANKSQRTRERLIKLALSFPEVWEDHPWGETVAKVGKKVFLFCGGLDPNDPPITVKLRDSLDQARDLGAQPAGYGLGKSGWVMASCSAIPAEILEDWVEESYRIVAPKRVSARLDQAPAP